MSAAVTSGAVAQLLQAQPKLTPLETKFALQFTAQFLEGYGLVEQGAGSLNVALAANLVQSRNRPVDPWNTIGGEEVRAGELYFADGMVWSGGVV